MPQAGSSTFNWGEALVEGFHFPPSLADLALAQEQRGGSLDAAPFLAQRLNDRGQHQALHIGPGRVVRAQLVTHRRVQGLLQERAEDGGLHVAPIGPGGFQ